MIDLRGMTFIIPFFSDCPQRIENLKIVMDFWQSKVLSNFIFCEQGSNDIPTIPNFLSKPNITYIQEPKRKDGLIHRTKLLNKMTKIAKTPVISNCDADVLCKPEQIYEAFKNISEESLTLCYPFDGDFLNASDDTLKRIKRDNDINFLLPVNYNRTPKRCGFASLGGMVLFHKERFRQVGWENENFISWGAEDIERYKRSIKLEHKVKRIQGPLFHLDHPRGKNCGKSHEMYKRNCDERDKVIYKLDQNELIEYIKTWDWC